jgi:site-specific recombinase XerC
MAPAIAPRELTRTAFRRPVGYFPLPPEGGDLRQLARSFRRDLEERQLSPNTVNMYLSSIKMFGEFLVEQGMPLQVASLTGEHVREFLHGLTLAGRSDNTRASRHGALVAFFKWLVDEGELTRDPMERIERPTIKDTPPEIVSDADISALLNTCRGNDFMDRRDHAIIRLFFDIGVRRSGLAYLRVQDLDLEEYPPAVTIVGKGHLVYTAAIGRKTAAALDRYLRVRARHKHADSERLWLGREGPISDGTVADMLKRRAAEAGLVGFHAHLFRHKFAHDQLSEPDVKEGDVMYQGGWRDTKMLRRYARSAAAERARVAHARKDLSSRL